MPETARSNAKTASYIETGQRGSTRLIHLMQYAVFYLT
jgi:hypothetical protein